MAGSVFRLPVVEQGVDTVFRRVGPNTPFGRLRILDASKGFERFTREKVEKIVNNPLEILNIPGEVKGNGNVKTRPTREIIERAPKAFEEAIEEGLNLIGL